MNLVPSAVWARWMWPWEGYLSGSLDKPEHILFFWTQKVKGWRLVVLVRRQNDSWQQPTEEPFKMQTATRWLDRSCGKIWLVAVNKDTPTIRCLICKVKKRIIKKKSILKCLTWAEFYLSSGGGNIQIFYVSTIMDESVQSSKWLTILENYWLLINY